MHWLGRFYGSTIGKKVVMAVTGIIFTGFVVGHVAGNLLVYKSPEALNAYAAFLKSSAVVLWSVRITLLASVLLHAHAAWSLTRLARAARSSSYDRLQHRAGTWSGYTMRWGGVLLLVFIVYHLLHFTVGSVHPAFRPTDVYANVIAGFRVPWVAAFYLAAMVALALHLHHGVWSFFQTLGINHPHLNAARRGLAALLAILVPAGFIAIVLGVLFRVVQ